MIKVMLLKFYKQQISYLIMIKRGQDKKLKIFSLHPRRAQMKLSFGMMFSIILIIIFLAFAFYAIMKLLNLQGQVTVGKFIEDLQEDVDKIWAGSGGSQEFKGSLPSEITYICFVDYNSSARGAMQNLYSRLRRVYTGYENLFFHPLGASDLIDSTEIKHLNILEITSEANPFCIANTNKKVKMTLSRSYGEELVRIEE